MGEGEGRMREGVRERVREGGEEAVDEMERRRGRDSGR